MKRFRDRNDAGAQLAEALAGRGLGPSAIVLGIPRGGVPIAAQVARRLGAELGVVVARKIGAPGRAELAIGATTASGATFIDRAAALLTGADEGYIASERARQVREAQRREAIFGVSGQKIAGRQAIVVDDGLATGATAFAAIRSVRAQGARSVVLAVPVAASRTVARFSSEADDVVCLVEDPEFMAVGYYYDDFRQVTDDEVRAVLESARTPSPP